MTSKMFDSGNPQVKLTKPVILKEKVQNIRRRTEALSVRLLCVSRSIVEINSLPKIEDLVIFVHDMGESSCSESMRKLIRDSYRKKPDNIVITIDYSPIVSFCSKSVP